MNPWLRPGPCTPEACVRAPAAVAAPVQRLARLLAATLVLLAGLPVALAASRLHGVRQAEITKLWACLLLRALGIQLKITATGVPEGALLVANHISWLDPLVMAATVPSRPLAKREVGQWPVIRTLATGSGALFIDRDRLYALPAAVATVADALRAGDTVIAFPEGTTWCGRGMGQFRPAVFQAAIDAGAAVLPATLRYLEGESLSTRCCYVGNDSLLASVLRVAATRHLVVEVTLLAPVWGNSRGALARIAEAQVRAGALDSHQVSAKY